MLHFLRHIRQKLILQENVRKYLLYAFGEIVLVVIGILIALQVNNWNENRKEHQRELQYLDRLADNIRTDLEVFEDNILFYEEVQEAGILALSYLEGKDLTEYSNWDILISFFNASQIWPMIIESSTYEELKSSGELSLINNVRLRDRMAFYYEGAKQRYDQTIGINPPYRKLSRVLIPFEVQNYMWDNCHKTVGDIQELVKCKPGISETASKEILIKLKSDPELTGELSFWLSSIRAGWHPLLENVKLCNTILEEIDNYQSKEK